MSLNLPVVLQAVSTIGAVASSLSDKPENQLLVNVDLDDVKKIIIMTTRDISKADRKLLTTYGLVVDHNARIHLNLSLEAMQFAYLIVDLRQADDRLFYQKSVLGNSNYHQVMYCWKWETTALQFESIFNEFPPIQASKIAYDRLLCTPPIEAPSACLSFLSLVATCAKA